MSIRIDKNGNTNKGITIASALKLYNHKTGFYILIYILIY